MASIIQRPPCKWSHCRKTGKACLPLPVLLVPRMRTPRPDLLRSSGRVFAPPARWARARLARFGIRISARAWAAASALWTFLPPCSLREYETVSEVGLLGRRASSVSDSVYPRVGPSSGRRGSDGPSDLSADSSSPSVATGAINFASAAGRRTTLVVGRIEGAESVLPPRSHSFDSRASCVPLPKSLVASPQQLTNECRPNAAIPNEPTRSTSGEDNDSPPAPSNDKMQSGGRREPRGGGCSRPVSHSHELPRASVARPPPGNGDEDPDVSPNLAGRCSLQALLSVDATAAAALAVAAGRNVGADVEAAAATRLAAAAVVDSQCRAER
eukprot:GHVT01015234.1.p1 GENE.GHVT01015234.1~~GHVT01015234.1.p1  ORF type:complete len:328 (-),score=67.24 GHVT01015234.1:824-1807(-)